MLINLKNEKSMFNLDMLFLFLKYWKSANDNAKIPANMM